MKTPLRFGGSLTTLLLFGLGGATAYAQPTDRGGDFDLAARYSHTDASDLNDAGPGAEVGVDSFSLALRASASLGEQTRLLYGMEWTRHDLAGTHWLPDDLSSVAAPLGVSHAFDDTWRLLVSVTPRLAGADGGLSSARLDVPVLAVASYTVSPELTWSFGLRYGPRSDTALLPIAGVVWQFAPDWNLKVGWPESGVSWRATRHLTLRAVATIHGGDYRLGADPRSVADRAGPSLGDTWLEYREIRVGLAAEYAIGSTLSLRADFGQVVDQRFEYTDRNVTLDGESPLYFGGSVVVRF
jgi:hypothetical protein